MSQKAWMQAYTKGSKSLQARLAKIHANNPEFQDFVKKHGFGGNLSVKQSGIQKKTSIGVQQTEKNAPTKGPVDREAVIRAAAEKLRDRKLAGANRAAFGGELGGGWSLPNMSFRTYRESLDYKGLKSLSKKPTKAELAYMNKQPDPQADRDSFERIRKKFARRANIAYLGGKKVQEELKIGDKVKLKQRWAGHEDRGLTFTVHHKNANGDYWIGRGKDKAGWYVGDHQVVKVRSVREETINELSKDRLKWYVKHALRNMNDLDDMGGNLKKTVKRALSVQKAKRKMAEDIAYKDGQIAMYKGGWIAKRDGKRLGTVVPTDAHAKHYIDSTRKSLTQKTVAVIRKKAKDIMRGLGSQSFATESRENRERVLSYDSAVVTSKGKLPKLTTDRKSRIINKIIAHMSNPKYSVVSNKYVNAAFKLAKEESEMSSEKTLNELRKATLASYIQKATRTVRADTSLGKDFEHTANQYLKKAWDAEGPLHYAGHPARDPEAAKDARAGYNANAGLEKDFKDKARKRIKGVDRAAAKLAKEEAEQIDEISVKTASKAAEKAHGEFQKAVKDKNWHKAAKRVRQANKFGDYTVPKKGWSYEEEVQHDGRSQVQEIARAIYQGKRATALGDTEATPEPVMEEQKETVVEQPKELSATEKYRQIRETMARKGK